RARTGECHGGRWQRSLQGGRDTAELGRGQPGREPVLDGGEVMRHRLAETGETGFRERRVGGASIGGVVLTADETLGDELVYDAADPSPAEHDTLPEVAHPQPSLWCCGQLQEDVVPAQRQSGGLLERLVDLRD